MNPVGKQRALVAPLSRPGNVKKRQKNRDTGAPVPHTESDRCGKSLSARRINNDPELKKWSTIAKDTAEILRRRALDLGEGTIDLGAMIDYCVNNTVCFGPHDELSLQPPGHLCALTRIEVTQETSLAACSRICAEQRQKKKGGLGVACLNFASAVAPGGMFMDGTNTQEDSLARSSALYASLGSQKALPMYQYNRARHGVDRGLNSDALIYSPAVPVFRDDGGNRHAPYRVSVISAPAVDRSFCAGVPEWKIQDAMGHRARKILTVAVNNDVKHLILGAWGCGIFGHNGADIAQLFFTLLAQEDFQNRFVSVTFPMTEPALFQVFTARFLTRE